MAIYKPTTNLNNKTLDGTVENQFTIKSSGDEIKGYKIIIKDYKEDSEVYNSGYVEYPTIGYPTIPANTMVNGRDYSITIRAYNQHKNSDEEFNTIVSRGRITGSSKKLLLVQIPKDEELAKQIRQSINEFYTQYFVQESTIVVDLRNYIDYIYSGRSEGIKNMIYYIILNHNTINIEGEIEKVLLAAEDEIFDNLKYDSFIQVDINKDDYHNNIIGSEVPKLDTYSQRCRIDWVTKDLGDSKDWAIVELSDDKIDKEREGFDYTFVDGTEFSLYPISGLHTTSSFFINPAICERLKLGNMVMFYTSAEEALKAHEAGDTPTSITIKPVYTNASRIIGLSPDTGEVRLQSSLAFAPTNGMIPRFFALETDIYEEIYPGVNIIKKDQTYHTNAGGALLKKKIKFPYYKSSMASYLPELSEEMASSGFSYKVCEIYPTQISNICTRGGKTFPNVCANLGDVPSVPQVKYVLFGRKENGSKYTRWYTVDQYEAAFKDETYCTDICIFSVVAYKTTTVSWAIPGTPTEIKTAIDALIPQTYESGKLKYICIAYNKKGEQYVCCVSTDCTEGLLDFNPVGYTVIKMDDGGDLVYNMTDYNLNYDQSLTSPYKFKTLAGTHWFTYDTLKLNQSIEEVVRKETYSNGTQTYYDYECLYPKGKTGYPYEIIDGTVSRLKFVKDVYIRTPQTFDCYAFTPYYSDENFINFVGLTPKNTTLTATFVNPYTSTIAIDKITYYIRTPKTAQTLSTPIMYEDKELTLKINTVPRNNSYFQLSPRTCAMHELVSQEKFWDYNLADGVSNTVTYGIYGDGRFLFLDSNYIYDADINRVITYENPGFSKLYFGTQKYVGYINNKLYYSYDLANWETIEFTNNITFIYHFAGKWFITEGSTTNMSTHISEDGLITFTKIEDFCIRQMTHGLDHFYILDNSGTLKYSSDGKEWITTTYTGYSDLFNISGIIEAADANTGNNVMIDVDGTKYGGTSGSSSGVSSINVANILDCVVMPYAQTAMFATSGYSEDASTSKGINFITRTDITITNSVYCNCDFNTFMRTQTLNTLVGETTVNAWYEGDESRERYRYKWERMTGIKGKVKSLKATKVGDYYTGTPLYTKNPYDSTKKFRIIDDRASYVVNSPQGFEFPMGYIPTPKFGIAPVGTQLYTDMNLTQTYGTTTYPVRYMIIDGTVSSTSNVRVSEEETTGHSVFYYMHTPVEGYIPLGTPIYSDKALTNLVGTYTDEIDMEQSGAHLIVPEALNYPLYDPEKDARGEYSVGDEVTRPIMAPTDGSTPIYSGPYALAVYYKESDGQWYWQYMASPYNLVRSYEIGSEENGIYICWHYKNDGHRTVENYKFVVKDSMGIRDLDTENYFWIDDNCNNLGKLTDVIVYGAYSVNDYLGLFRDAELEVPAYEGDKFSIGCLDSDIIEIPPNKLNKYERTYISDGLPYKVSSKTYIYRYRIPPYVDIKDNWDRSYFVTHELEYVGYQWMFNRHIYRTYIDQIDKYMYAVATDHVGKLPYSGSWEADTEGECVVLFEDLAIDNLVKSNKVPMTNCLGGWNCVTGIPDNPPTSGYTYKDGDYYIISNVNGIETGKIRVKLCSWNADTGLPYASTSSETVPQIGYTYKDGDYYYVKTASTTNYYMPTGTSYTGIASTTSSNKVKAGDVWRFCKKGNDEVGTWLLANRVPTGLSYTREMYNPEYEPVSENDIYYFIDRGRYPYWLRQPILYSTTHYLGEQWIVNPDTQYIEADEEPVLFNQTKYLEQKVGGNPLKIIEPHNIIRSNNKDRIFIKEDTLITKDNENPMQLIFDNGCSVDLTCEKDEFNKIGGMYMIDNVPYDGTIPTDEYNHIAPETKYTIKTCYSDSAPSKVYARSPIGVSVQFRDYYQGTTFNEYTGTPLNYRDVEFKCFTDFKKDQGITVDTIEWSLSKDGEIVKESGKIYDPTETWIVRGLVNGNYNIIVTVNNIYTTLVNFSVSFSDTPEDFVDISQVPEDCEYPEGISSPAMKLLLKKGDKDHRIYSIFKLGVYDEVYRFIESIEVDTNKDVIFYDYNVANGEYFKYFVYRDEPDVVGYKTCETEWTQFCEPVAYWLDELEEDVEETDTYKVKKSLKMYLTPNSGSLTVNQGNTWQDTITKYGLLTKSNKNYHSGNLSVLAGEVVDGVYVDKVDEYKEILLSNNLKLLRTPKGERFVIAVTGAPTLDTNYVSNLMQTTITIPWSEVEDSEKITVYSYKLGEGLIPENAVAFASLTPFTVQLDGNKWYGEGTLEYSLDNINWTTYPNDGTSVLPTPAIKNGEEYYMIYLRGVGNTRTYHYDEETSTDYGTYFVTTGTFNLLGKFNNLLDYTASSVSCDSCCYLFYDTGVVDASDFIMSDNLATITTYNYYGMFYNCSSLTTPPELPATTLADYCYSWMFSGCTSLTTPPELPATTLDNSCYNRMFQNCYSLKTAPELPATTLTYGCYFRMFDGCESLTIAPELPATTLTLTCYNYMFNNCISLTTPPSTLPATQLATSCYDNMFYGCTNLAAVPDMTITKNGVSACYQMFFNCESIKTANNIIIQHANAKNCCEQMFYGCTSLETPPQLPATSLHEGCYQSMFNGCASLITAPALPATYMYNNCYAYMFQDCASLTTPPPSLPATSLSYQCYRMMFVGCSSLTDIPSFAPSALAPSGVTNYSCWYMFQNCSSLRINTTATTKGKFVAPSEVPIGSARGMFSGVAEFPESEGVPVAGTTYYAQ